MIYSLDVKEILTAVAYAEFGDLPWKPVVIAVNEAVKKFEPTPRPVLAAIRLDLAVLDMRLALQGVQKIPPEAVQWPQ